MVLLASQGSTSVTGTVAATGGLQLAGSIEVLGQSVAINSGALLDASGANGGGQILVGGQHNNTALLQSTSTSVALGALIDVDATLAGNGGDVSVYGSGLMRMDGQIDARGGTVSGNGGKVETSGDSIEIMGSVDAAARSVGGTAGSWLLDPTNVTIDTAGTGYTVTSVNSDISSVAIANALDSGTSVDIQTSAAAINNSGASITVNSAINATAVINNASLTLEAGGAIIINAAITGIPSIAGSGTALVLNLNSDLLPGSGPTGVSVNAPIYMPGGSINISGASFSNATGNTIYTHVFDAGLTGTGGFNNLGSITAGGDQLVNSSDNGGTLDVTSMNGPLVTGALSINSNGGSPGTMSLNAQSISISGPITAEDANLTTTAIGGGVIGLYATGDITNTSAGNLISADGSFNGVTGGSGGNITLSAGGNLTLLSMTISATGGSPNNATSGGDGGDGGSITALGTAINLNSVSMYFDGGDGAASSLYEGGAGGVGGFIFLGADNVAIFGGPFSATGGSGGAGGAATAT